MLPIVCIVGASNSGKTTFLEKLIPEVKRRGYRVGALKHDAHDFEMDHEGKDTWRLRRAGAETIGITSPEQIAVIRQTAAEMGIEEVAGRLFWWEDILLTEGFKRSHYPKIEVFRTAVEPRPICTTQDNLIGIISDDPVESGVPLFRFADVSGVADMIEERFLKGRKERDVAIRLDGKQLPMNDFVRDFLVGGILGMLSSLRGWSLPKTIDISIRVKEE